MFGVKLFEDSWDEEDFRKWSLSYLVPLFFVSQRFWTNLHLLLDRHYSRSPRRRRSLGVKKILENGLLSYFFYTFRYYKYMNNNRERWYCRFIASPPRCLVNPGIECNEDNLDTYTYHYLIWVYFLFSFCGIIIYSWVRLFLVARQSDENMRHCTSSA